MYACEAVSLDGLSSPPTLAPFRSQTTMVSAVTATGHDPGVVDQIGRMIELLDIVTVGTPDLELVTCATVVTCVGVDCPETDL